MARLAAAVCLALLCGCASSPAADGRLGPGASSSGGAKADALGGAAGSAHQAGGVGGTGYAAAGESGTSLAGSEAGGTASVDAMRWHDFVLTFEGPESSEAGTPNPFSDYRLNVTFEQGTRKLVVPGYFAADGNAAETSASSGNRWRVDFTPDAVGEWTWSASFRGGQDVAIDSDPLAGMAVAGIDGQTGSLSVRETDKTGRDFRAHGLLSYVGERYLRFAGTQQYFLKAGADSPENFLGYFEFDGTVDHGGSVSGLIDGLHHFAPHLSDFRDGDPTWQGGKGKGLLGALNYLAEQGVNSLYFLTLNVDGDGREVYPFSAYDERERYDVSKLGQWQIAFQHMESLGLMLHVVTQETECDQLLDQGELGRQRKLYYRELVARFGHHLALVWNLGEENTNSDAQRAAFAAYLKDIDPFKHPVVVHTFPGQKSQVYAPLLGQPQMDGVSLQMGSMSDTHAEVTKWLDQSAGKQHSWFACLDEIGPADVGVKPDAVDPNHDDVRQQALWGNLMAGGAGAEWYFGYGYPNGDLDLEDFRSREHMWQQSSLAIEFLKRLPLAQMKHDDGLASGAAAFVLAKRGASYLIYLPQGGQVSLDLSDASGTLAVRWFNPRSGGALLNGSVASVAGGAVRTLGAPPASPALDWVALLEK